MSGLHRLLSYLEKRAGNLDKLIKPRPLIVDSDLQRSHLQALFGHEAAAVHIRGFYPQAAAAELATRLIADQTKLQEWLVVSPGKGLESSDVRTIGLQPYSMVAASRDPKAAEIYFDGAVPAMRELRTRQIGKPYILSPLDQLRLELDEIWPNGATVSKNKEGRPFVAGLARVMTGPTDILEGFCHVDDLSPLRRNEGLFSANIYLQMPDSGGGKLLIWDVEIWSRLDFYRNAITLANLTAAGLEGQARLRSRFPEPRVLTPEPGDLILLCAQRPHAVQGFPFGTRVSFQSFVSYKETQALRLDN